MTKTRTKGAGAQVLTREEAKQKRLAEMREQNAAMRWLLELREEWERIGEPYWSKWLDQYLDHVKRNLTVEEKTRCYEVVNVRRVWTKHTEEDEKMYTLLEEALEFAKKTLEARKNIAA